MSRLILSALALPILLSSLTQAQVKLDGTFTASKTCPAVTSIKKSTNPGNAAIEAGKSYTLLGKNKDNASHYWIEVPGANPAQRWVALNCGTLNEAAAGQVTTAKPVDTAQGTVKQKPASRGFGGRAPSYAFALSWEPTFCEAMRSKVECRIEKPSDFQSTHFSLHGLWPQPRRNQFCNVDAATASLDDQHRWEELPEPQLTPETRANLDVIMPGTKSDLERHEWIKHGTCYPSDNAESYFKDAIRLTAEVNNSQVQKLVASKIGQNIAARDLRAAFDQSFGKGAGEAVQFECDKQGRFSGITLNLRGDIPGGAQLSDLLQGAEQARNKCDAGLVDPAG